MPTEAAFSTGEKRHVHASMTLRNLQTRERYMQRLIIVPILPVRRISNSVYVSYVPFPILAPIPPVRCERMDICCTMTGTHLRFQKPDGCAAGNHM